MRLRVRCVPLATCIRSACYCPPLVDRTLVIVKPDGVERGLVGEIVGRLERKNLRLVAAELRTVSTELAQAHYEEHAERPFFADLVAILHALACPAPGDRRSEGHVSPSSAH